MTGASEPPEGLKSEDAYALVAARPTQIEAPVLPYAPPMPRDRSVPIALVGAGGISSAHLDAYRAYGLNVVAICDRHAERARARRDRYFPDARVETDADAVIGDPRIQVVDLAVHAAARQALIAAALQRGKHVLSQKPFVSDLAVGTKLADLAERSGLVLAVNQNGRWAPYMAYMREAVLAGIVGDVIGVHVSIQWDHTWIAGTPFEQMDQIILQDFAIHWFDFLASIIGDSATTIYAVGTAAKAQGIASQLLASCLVTFPGGQASLVFDGSTRYGAQNSTTIVGTGGTLRSTGPDLGEQSVSVHVAAGVGVPALAGRWFNDGFAGAMGALLVAAETGVPPSNGARNNLISLKLANGALESARLGGIVRLQ